MVNERPSHPLARHVGELNGLKHCQNLRNMVARVLYPAGIPLQRIVSVKRGIPVPISSVSFEAVSPDILNLNSKYISVVHSGVQAGSDILPSKTTFRLSVSYHFTGHSSVRHIFYPAMLVRSSMFLTHQC